MVKNTDVFDELAAIFCSIVVTYITPKFLKISANTITVIGTLRMKDAVKTSFRFTASNVVFSSAQE
jgi:hypothetical protein